MASVDLKDAYFSIPVVKEHKKFLRFRSRDQLFQFTCLPNGLAEAPRQFTKILKVPFAHFRAQGQDNSANIDDSCLLGTSFDDCHRNVEMTTTLLDSLGFTIHPDKSCLVPTQVLTYLGFILDSVDMTVSLTKEKAAKIVKLSQILKRKNHWSIREVAV